MLLVMAGPAQPLSERSVPIPRRSDPMEGLRPVVTAVVASVLGMPRSHADVQDGVAETFRRAVEGSSRVRPGEAIGPWVTGIARHVALDLVRARRRARLRQGSSDEDGENSADPAPGPEEIAISAQRIEGLRRALAELADGPREALLAFHVEGLPYHLIAERLGVPMGTVATWIARGRKTLASVLMDASSRTAEEP